MKQRLQSYLVFQPFSSYLTGPGNKIIIWQSKGVSEETIALPPTANNISAQNWIGKYSIPTVNINKDYLEQSRVSFIHGNVVNLYISYKLNTRSKD